MILDSARIRWALRGLPDLTLAKAFYQVGLHTMTRPVRGRALWRICKEVLAKEIPGDFVECGVWRGGSAGLMALALQKFSKTSERRLYLYDSFEGLPPPGPEDGKVASTYWQTTTTSTDDSSQRCVASLATVRSLMFDSLKIAPRSVVIHPGWFQQVFTNPLNLPLKVAVLRLDGDWYESTKICFEYLYDRVAPGGAVILDDYDCWEGCKKATDEFRTANAITEPLIRIDNEAVYWIKKH